MQVAQIALPVLARATKRMPFALRVGIKHNMFVHTSAATVRFQNQTSYMFEERHHVGATQLENAAAFFPKAFEDMLTSMTC